MKARHMRLSEEQSVCLTNNGKTYLTWSDTCSLTANAKFLAVRWGWQQARETAPFQCSPIKASLVVQAGKIQILDPGLNKDFFYHCAVVNTASFKR